MALAFVNGTNFTAFNVPIAVGTNAISAVALDIYGNTATNTITVTSVTNSSGTLVDPVQLTGTPTNGFVPLTVAFQASANVPGTILQVLYDFDGDGVPDQTNANLSAVNYTYSSAGQYFPMVTVQTPAASFSSLGGWNSYNPPLQINAQKPPSQLNTISVTNPVDVKWLAGENIYVLSGSTATITEFGTNGSVVRSLAGIGSGAASAPSGLDVDANGNVYAAITGDNQVWKFKPASSSFVADTNFGGRGYIGNSYRIAGSAPAQFDSPYDVAVTPDGTAIYVTDTANNRIQQFTSSGSYVATIGFRGTNIGQFNSPKGISSAPDGTLVVVDSGNSRVAAMLGGGVLGVFGQAGTSPGQFESPLNAASSGLNIYVADSGNNQIQKFNSQTFNPVWQISSQLGLSHPAGVSMAADPNLERVYIADTGNNRIVAVVLPRNDPLDVWNAAKQDLINGDINSAFTLFSAVTVDGYRNQFLTIGANEVSRCMSAIGQVAPLEIYDYEARYSLTNTIGGQQFIFIVNLVVENGLWKVRNF
jgi:DNA-binding beta-propeller fold protein YncE